jgi:hypothetical protein
MRRRSLHPQGCVLRLRAAARAQDEEDRAWHLADALEKISSS